MALRSFEIFPTIIEGSFTEKVLAELIFLLSSTFETSNIFESSRVSKEVIFSGIAIKS